MIIAFVVLFILLLMATIVTLYLVANTRKNKPHTWSNGDTEVIYTDWHTFGHSGFLQDDIRNAKYLLSLKRGNYVLDNVIFEWKYRGDTSFVRAKVIFKKKVDNDEIAEDQEAGE